MTWLALVLASCAGVTPASPEGATPEVDEGAVPSREPSPRVLASLELTQQARTLLERGQFDDAISVLERAVSLNPTSAENFYYLAEAWLMKGDTTQAEEFNRLADLYLKGDDWEMKVVEQRERITESHR